MDCSLVAELSGAKAAVSRRTPRFVGQQLEFYAGSDDSKTTLPITCPLSSN